MSAAWLAGWRPYALLGLLCLCLYLPGIAAIPVLDRDEARFAEATRQMLESGDFLHIRFRDEARNNKPAGIYWLQATSVATLSTPAATAIWPYRVPSLLAAGLAVLLTFRLGRALTGEPRTAMIAAVLLALALGTVAEAHIAKTDAALLAAVSAGQGALGLCYARRRAGQQVTPGIAAGFWLAEIAAIFLKGPVGPGIALATAAALSLADRDVTWLLGLRPLLGLAATVLAVAPWLYAIEHATGGQFLDQSVGRDFWSKITGGQEAHGAPPLYYVVLAFVSFWPGSLLLAPAVIGGWRRRGEPVARFLLAWLVPAWVALELVPTKLPHYTLPLYPALALLAAAAVTRHVEGGRWARWVGAAGTSLWLLATVLLAAALIVAPLRLGGGASAIGIVGAAAIAAPAAALAAALLYRRHVSIAALAAMALAFVALAGQFIVPSLDRLWLSRGAAALVARHQPPDGTMLAVVGYNEPSLVFLTGNRVKAQTADVPVAAGSEALVSSRDDAAFRQAIASQGLTVQPLDSVAGADYSNGQEMTLTLYKIAPR
jgi:4-amino-4-deoxy-L-arabinose transferase-like glycosyltransferase